MEQDQKPEVVARGLRHYIGGAWVESKGGRELPVINPATEQAIVNVSAASPEDVDAAVKAARAAFDDNSDKSWRRTTGKQRAVYLREIARKVEEKHDYLTKLECLDSGKPIREAVWDINDVAGCFNYYAEQAEELDKRQDTPIKVPEESFRTRVQYVPVGVAAAIIPWNYPLLMAAWKVAPALAAGCTIVLKPSELTPLTALELADIIHAVGLPPGVFNLITGYGDAGEVLSKHPLVDKVAFTGSVVTGTKVMSAACNDLKRVTLELGGKSPIIVFEDVDIEQAVEWIMFGVFFNSGQVCSATSRLIIHESIVDTVLKRLVEESRKIYIGDPFTSKEPCMGPLVNSTQYQRVRAYIDKGNKEGAKMLLGGEREGSLSSPLPQKGYFVPPTIFVDVKPDMTIWKEEIFGPVLAVMNFKTEEEAVHLANDTFYGLAGAVMTKDSARSERVVRDLRAGIVWINCSQPTFTPAPWGGMKKSGIGRELGPWGLDNYLEVKQVTSYEDITKPWGFYIKNNL